MQPTDLFVHILRDGLILSLLASLFILVSIRINPRLWLGDYPKAIQAEVEPKSADEKRQSLMIGIPFLVLLFGVPLVSTWSLQATSPVAVPFLNLYVNAAGVAFVFNLVDWLVLDWLIFCTLTPDFLVIPGTKSNPAYKDYAFHLRGFIIGTILSAIAGLVLAGIVWMSVLM